MNTGTNALNSCKYLYLHEIGEPSDNVLRLLIAEAVAEGQTDITHYPVEFQKLLTGSKPIVHTTKSRMFQITWPSYIGYSVRNESFALPEKDDGKRGLFVEFTQSRYLDFIAASTFADADHPGPFKNWAIYCLNHTIDVVSTEEPVIVVKSHA